MDSLATHERDDEPTRPCNDVKSRILVAAARIERLAEVAAERIAAASPDEDALALAAIDLAQIRDLARSVQS